MSRPPDAGATPPRPGGAIRVLVVDDSPSVRAVLRRFFSWTEDIRVVGEAADGAAAVAAALELAPEVVLMDLVMPGVDGYRAIEEIMRRAPTPILVLSSRAVRDGVRTAFEALRRGAVEVLPKPEDPESWRHLAVVLPRMVREIARRPAGGAPRPPAPPRPGRAGPAPPAARDLRWLAIGASTGGPGAVRELLAALPARPPVTTLVVQHIAPGFEEGLADWLSADLGLDVALAGDGEAPSPGVVRLAPPGAHLQLAAGGRLRLDRETPPSARGHRPSVDELFASCARCCPERVAAVLLTGMGDDGVEGMLALAAGGALTLVQDEASSVVYGMPRAAWARGAATRALPPAEIAREVARCWEGAGR
jgi:two-component system chemotaxis response regulator CheB